MKTLVLKRNYTKYQTWGYLFEESSNQLELVTLEKAWKENQRRISCIPEGKYLCKPHVSPKFGKCFWLQDVPCRSEILIHAGNYQTDSLGCLLVGLDFADLNKDGHRDITSSKDGLKELVNMYPDGFYLSIEE